MLQHCFNEQGVQSARTSFGTFCSHLAMRGAAPNAIQELAGHSTLSVTLRYMHLAPSALREAIGLLVEEPAARRSSFEIS